MDMKTIDITPVSTEYIYSAGSRNSRGGGKGSSGQQRPPKEYDNTLESRGEISMMFLVGEGEVVDLQGNELLKAIHLDNTPIMNPNGTLNFKGIKAGFRPGTLSQGHIPYNNASESEQIVNQEVFFNQGAVTRQLTSPTVEAVRVKITIPALSYVDEKSGDIRPNDVSFAIDISIPGGGWVNRVSDVISGKCTTPYEVSYHIPLPPSATNSWNIRVRRLSPDSTTERSQNRTFFTSMTLITYGHFTYPGSALLWLRINSNNFSSVPSVKLLMKGKKILVPSNYDPVLKQYHGLWDGSFILAYSNNPAWILYDLLVNNRYGMGKYLDSSLINKWSIYSAGQYCDEVVSNYRGGQERRFEFNGVIQDARDATELLTQIASMFRSSLIWTNSNIELVQDRPQNPERFFSPSNVLLKGQASTFSYSSSAKAARHSSALVTYVNPAHNYEPDIESVENEKMLTKYGYNATRVEAIGCTSTGQAHRLGLWTVLTEELLTETVSFQVGMEGANLRLGMVIGINDPMKQIYNQAGRVVRSAGTTLTLDAPAFTTAVAVGDAIRFYSASTGQLVQSWIQNILFSPEGWLEVHIQDIGHTPIEFSPWSIFNAGLQPKLFRIIDISQVGKEEYQGVYEVTALEYNGSLYDAVDFGSALFEPPSTLSPPTVTNAPFNVQGKAHAVLREGKWFFMLQATWNHPLYAGLLDPYTSYYEVQYKQGTHGAWTALRAVDSTFIEYENVMENIYILRVRAIDSYKRASAWVESPQIVTTRPIPKNPIGTITKEQNIDNSIYLSFSDTQNYAYGIIGYAVTIQEQGKAEEHLQIIPLGVFYTDPILRPPGVYTVRIYALDSTYQRSAVPLSIVLGNEFMPPNPNGTLIVSVLDDRQLQFFWQDDTMDYGNSFAGYRLYKRVMVNGEPEYTFIQQTENKFSQPFKHNDSVNATYEVYAVNTRGYQSGQSMSFDIAQGSLTFTVPSPMGVVQKISAPDGGILLRWTDTQLYEPARFGGYRIFVNDVLIGTSQVREFPSYMVQNPAINNSVKIRAFYKNGLMSQGYIGTTLLPEDFFPPTPSYLLVDQTLQGIKQFYWELPDNPPSDISKFRVRYTRGSTKDWDNSHLLRDVLAGERSLDTGLFREGTYTVMIKSVDITNLESLGFVSATVNLFDPVPENVIQSWVYKEPSMSDPPITGSPWMVGNPVLHNLQINGDNNLTVIDPTLEAYYENVFEPTSVGHLKILLNATGNYRVEYKRAIVGDFWDEDLESEIFWHSDRESLAFWTSSEAWLDLPVAVQVHQEEYTIRVYWLPGGGSMGNLAVICDAPDVYMSFQNVAVSNSGNTRVFPNKPIRFLKSVTMNLQDTGTGATRVQILDKDPVQGVRIQAMDSSNALVNALVDVIMVGY